MADQYTCPACRGTGCTAVLTVKDWTVSHEDFVLLECSQCRLRYIESPPPLDKIGGYYDSVEYVSHSETRRGLINLAYSLVKPFTNRRKRRLVKRVGSRRGGRLLDIGCGTGYFAGLMQRAGWTVEGVEANHGARQLAIERYGLKVYTPDDFMDLADEKYDVITLWHVLEHVHDLDGYLLKIRSLLDNNSKLILALPNYTSYDARAYGALWAAYDAPRHLYNFTPGAVDKLVRRHNFSISSMAPMPLDAYYVSLESEKHRDNGGSLVRGAVLGFRSNLTAAGKPEKSSSVIYVCEPF